MCANVYITFDFVSSSFGFETDAVVAQDEDVCCGRGHVRRNHLSPVFSVQKQKPDHLNSERIRFWIFFSCGKTLFFSPPGSRVHQTLSDKLSIKEQFTDSFATF